MPHIPRHEEYCHPYITSPDLERDFDFSNFERLRERFGFDFSSFERLRERFFDFDLSNFEHLRNDTHMEWSHAPSYWDAVTRRLIQTALQAAAGSSTRVAAITNGSAAVHPDAVASSDSSCLSEEVAATQSLVITHQSTGAVHE